MERNKFCRLNSKSKPDSNLFNSALQSKRSKKQKKWASFISSYCMPFINFLRIIFFSRNKRTLSSTSYTTIHPAVVPSCSLPFISIHIHSFAHCSAKTEPRKEVLKEDINKSTWCEVGWCCSIHYTPLHFRIVLLLLKSGNNL